VTVDLRQFRRNPHGHRVRCVLRSLVFLLAAVAAILLPAALGPVSALGAPALGAQDRAGAFNPASRILVGGRSVEGPCSRRDPNTPDGGFDGGIVGLADGAPTVDGLYVYDVVVTPTTRLTTSLITTPLAGGPARASAERPARVDDQILGDEDAAALDLGENAAAETGTFLPDEYYAGKENDLAPGQSSPYSTYERFSPDGDLKQVTTYDQYGDRAHQYDLGDGARHGEGSHSFEYSGTNPRQAPGGGVRGDHEPF
jgi:hypothetical protein